MIDGAYNLLYLDFGEGFLPVGCLTSGDFSEDIEVLDSTTKENDGWRTQVLTNQGYEISFSGIAINTVYNGDTTKYSYDMLKILKRNRTLLDWKIENSKNGDVDNGQAQITTLSSSSNVGEFISFNCTLLGYGKVDSSNVTPIETGLQSQLEALI